MKPIETAKVLIETGKTFYEMHKSKICVYTGLGMVLVGTGVACYKAVKFKNVKADISKKLDEVHAKKPAEGEKSFDYSKELIKVYAKIGLKLGVYTAPALFPLLGGTALVLKGCGLYDNDISRLTDKVIVAEGALSAYRGRVVEEQGEEADEYYMYGIREEDTLTPVLDKEGNPKTDKNGFPVEKKEKQLAFHPEKAVDPHIIIFDESSPLYSGDPEHDIHRINLELQALNQRFHSPRMITRSGIISYINENDIRTRLCSKEIPGGNTFGKVCQTSANSGMDLDFGINCMDAKGKALVDAYISRKIDKLPLKLQVVRTTIDDEGLTHFEYLPFEEIGDVLGGSF